MKPSHDQAMFEEREAVISHGGMVTSPHHLASEAGAAVLRDGGSAVDAAIATAAVLAVTAPWRAAAGRGVPRCTCTGTRPRVRRVATRP